MKSKYRIEVDWRAVLITWFFAFLLGVFLSAIKCVMLGIVDRGCFIL